VAVVTLSIFDERYRLRSIKRWMVSREKDGIL